jgi:hypothetical protein
MNPCDIMEKQYLKEQDFLFRRMMSEDMIPSNRLVVNESNHCLSKEEMRKKKESISKDFEPLYKSEDTCVGFDCVPSGMLCKIWEPALTVMGEEVKGHSKAPMLWNISTKK